MILCFRLDAVGLHSETVHGATAVPEDALWIDLLEPTAAEESRIEQFLRVDVPTREEMHEIEASNRFYQEGDVLYMTDRRHQTRHAPSRKQLDHVHPDVRALDHQSLR